MKRLEKDFELPQTGFGSRQLLYSKEMELAVQKQI